MMELSIPEYDIKITEQSDGLMISQNGKSYLAKNWTLSRQVYSIIRIAIKKGFTCLWTDNNPRADNPEPTYICFSRSNRDPWDFKLNKEGHSKSFDGESLVTLITVQSEHLAALKAAGLDIKTERQTGGSHEVEIKPPVFEKALDEILKAPHPAQANPPKP